MFHVNKIGSKSKYLIAFTNFMLIIYFLVPNKSYCSNYFERLWGESKKKNLHLHPYWRKLLHFYFPGESLGQWESKSDVKSTNFFLSERGMFDPYVELKETIQAILEPVGENPNEHARCKFIARSKWLFKELNFPKLEYISCPGFDSWSNLDFSSEVRVIFVSSYLKNPASAFGHILLQFIMMFF